MQTRISFFVIATLLFSGVLDAQQQPPGTTAPQFAVPQQQSPLDSAEQKIESGDYAAAAKELAGYLAAHGNDARGWFDAGFAAQAQSDTAAAEKDFRRAIELNPNQFEATLALGLLLAGNGDSAAAQPLLERAVTLKPAVDNPAEAARAWRALAELDRKSLPATASNALLEALKLTPETPDDTLLAAEIAENSGDTAAAEAAYRRLLDKDKTNAQALSGLIHLLRVNNREADAEPLLREAIKAHPEDVALNTELALLEMHQGKMDDAYALLNKLHAANPKNDEISRLLADLLDQGGDASGSEELLTPLLGAHPHDFDLWQTHARNLVLLQRYDEAVEAYRTATQIEPSNGDGWAGLAFAASEAHKPELVLEALDIRDKFLPVNASSLFLRATANDSLRHKDAAIAAYKGFLAAAKGKYPNQEWQAKQRISLLAREGK